MGSGAVSVVNGMSGLRKVGDGLDQMLTAGTGAVVVFATFPAGTTHVLITVDTQAVRVRFGADPDANTGNYLAAGHISQQPWPVELAQAARFIGLANSALVCGCPLQF